MVVFVLKLVQLPPEVFTEFYKYLAQFSRSQAPLVSVHLHTKIAKSNTIFHPQQKEAHNLIKSLEHLKMQEKAERDLTEYDKREQANREQYVMLRSVAPAQYTPTHNLWNYEWNSAADEKQI